MTLSPSDPILFDVTTGGDANSIVTGLTITPSDPTTGTNVTMALTFNDPNDTLKQDDTITVNWPSTGSAYLLGYNQTFPLYDPTTGLLLANVDVTDGKAVITFTDNVSKVHDVHGSIKFKAKAWNTATGDAADSKTIQVTCGSISSSVTITKPESGDIVPDYYSKTGAIIPTDTTHVNWYLNTNVPKVDVKEPIHITDQIQAGQQLVTDSFFIYSTNPIISFPPPTAIADFEKAYPGSTITFDQADGTVDITLPPSVVNGINWQITYKTLITDKTLSSLANNSTITYWPTDSPAQETQPSNATVDNPYAEGDIASIPVGTLSIKKVLQQASGTVTNIALDDIKFKLQRTDGGDITTGETSVILTTDIDGKAEIADLPVGTYTLTELDPPDWLAPITEPIQFDITATATEGVYKLITNTKKTVNITGQKDWSDGTATHPTIWLKLYRAITPGAATVVPNSTLKELPSGTTSATWSGLDYADDSGNVYTYSVKEVDASGAPFTPVGYTKTENGLVVTNTLQTTSMTVNKTWVDNNNQDGLRPSKVTVTLNANGDPYRATQDLTSPNWSYPWSNLPLYKDGAKVVYTVTEAPVPDYTNTSSVSDTTTTLTNTHTPLTTSISVNKVWNDYENQDGVRPSKVTVTLNANGEAYGPTQDLTVPTWAYTWSGLPLNQDGKKITYTVTEAPVPDYTTSPSVSGNTTTLTNTHVPLITSVTVNKIWVDNNNQDGVRPSKVTITLNANGDAYGSSEILTAPTWSYTWNGLPLNHEGKKIIYTVTEAPVPDYINSSSVSGNTTTLTNMHTSLTTSVTASKTWVDNNNQDGLRPTKVTVTLNVNGVPSTPTQNLEAPTWSYTWSGLPLNADGKKIIYTVTETPVPNYTTSSSVSGNTTTFTNTHVPLTTSVTVNKIWVDNNNQDGVRPTKVTVTLNANGEIYGSTQNLTAPTWSYTWSGLPLYEEGKKIVYTVTEAPVPDYVTSSSVSDNTTTITNTHKSLTTSITVNKVWDDHNNQDGLRPSKVTVTLNANGEPYGTAVDLTAPTWFYTWSNLPVDKDGTKIVYTLTETPVPSYTTTSSVNGNTTTLTNTHHPQPQHQCCCCCCNWCCNCCYYNYWCTCYQNYCNDYCCYPYY